MDWLTCKFCVLIWVLCVSISKTQSQLLNSTRSLSNQLRSACEDGQRIVPPDECNTCICFAGQIYCTNIPCPEQNCVNGVVIPQPDACNKCICRRGKVTCSNMICIPAPHCAEKQLYPAQNKCNACMCMNGYITCTSNPCAEEPLPSTIPTTATLTTKSFNNETFCTIESFTTTKKPKKKKKCVEGDILPGPDECVECFCQNGGKRCKYICNPTLESRFSQGPECVPGQHIPRPDDCNNCICFEGQIHCTHLPCRMDTRIGPECNDNQLVYRPDECNECYCFEGRLECSDLVCIRGSKCVQGQVIPNPDSCNVCKCVEGHILCTDYQCPTLNSRNALRPGWSSTEVMTPDECQEGDIISPPPPPNDCNRCYCMDNHILCTTHSCEGSDPEIKGRLKKPNVQTDLEVFDKKISVEPFINMISKNNEKLPAKLIHTHAYNGFHQEIKVHASHLPKDATKLLRVLATSLDNSALASISQGLLKSSHSLSNNHDSEVPIDNQVVPTELLGEGNVLTTKSSKVITSGSQSNETILVIPNTEPFDPNSQSVLPSKHETIWKSVSSPATLVFNNEQQINSPSSQEEKLNIYYDNNRPSMFPSIEQNNVIRNPSKFSRPGHSRLVSTKPARNIVAVPNTMTQFYPASNPKSINSNDGKMNYAPISQESILFKPKPPGFVANRDELPHLRPYQATKAGQNQVFNNTSSAPIFRPGKYFVNPNNNGAQQKPLQSQFIPNLSNYYTNHAKPPPPQIQLKPNQNPLPTANNMGIQHPTLYPNNPNQPLIGTNQYKQPQFGLKPGQGSISPLINNKGNQTDQQFKALPPNYHVNPLINLPYQKKRISSVVNEGSEEIPPHSMVPKSTDNHTNILNPSQIGVDPKHMPHKSPNSQFIPNPSMYYRDEYEVPKINEVNPDQDQLPYSKTSYTEHNNPPYTSSESGYDTLIPKVRNKTRKYNTTHSRYEKYTTITYVSEYDPTNPAANPRQIMHDPNQNQKISQTNVYEQYLPDQDSEELDLTMSKINHYLSLPNLQLDQNEPHPKLNRYYSHQQKFPGQQQNYTQMVHPTSWNITSSDGKNPDPIKLYQNPSQSQFILSKGNFKKGSFNGPVSGERPQLLSNSAEDPTHPKSNEYLPSPSQSGPTKNQQPPGAFDDRGSSNGFQHTYHAYEDPRQLKPVHKVPPSKLETPLNHQLPGVFDDRGSAHGFQYPSNSPENPTNPKQNQKIQPYSPIGPDQKQHLPGMFDDRGSADGFQYPSYSAEIPTHPKESLHKLPQSQFLPSPNQHTPGVLDDRGSTHGFHYPSNSAEDSTYLNGKPPHSPVGSAQKQHLPGMFDERSSADGFQYPSNSAENPTNPKQNKKIQPNSLFGPAQKQHLPGMFDDRGSADGFQYPSHSVENPTHPNNNLHKLPQSQFLPSPNQHTPGVLDDRGSTHGFHYPSNSAEDSTYSKGIPPHSPVGSAQKQHLPGMFDDRGSADGFQYPSHSVENPTHPNNNLHKLPQSQFLPSPNQHTPGVLDDRGSAHGFHYPSNSAEDSTYSKQNKPIHPNSPFGPAQKQHIPGMFDERGSADSFQYPSNSAESLTHPKDTLYKLPQSQFLPSPNKHTPGMFDDRGSANGFQYPSNSAENPTNPKQNKKIQPNSPFGPAQKQHLPGIFDERGSADGFHYPSNSAEDSTHSKGKLPQSPLASAQKQNLPGIFDDRGSADGFQYPSNSIENPTHPKDNLHKLPQSQFLPSPNQHTPGMFDDRGSANGFQYPSNLAENPTNPKQNKKIQPNSPFSPAQKQHLPGIFDDRGSADGFQYPSHSVKNPTHPTNNLHKLPQSQLLPSPNQNTPGVLDDRGSAHGFHYPSNSAEDSTHSKQNKPIHPNSPFGPAQKQHIPGMFDERGSADGFQYPSNSAESLTHPKDTLYKLPQSQFLPSPNKHTPGVFDDPGSAHGFHYPSNSAEDSTHPKDKQPHSPLGPVQKQHLPGIFDDRGSADGFQYPSNSIKNPTYPKNNLHKLPQSPQKQHIPGIFDDRGSADGFQYPSYSADIPTHPKDNLQKLPQSQFLPTHNQHTPGVLDDRGAADGFQYPSNSAENPTNPKQNKKIQPNSPFGPAQKQHLPGMFDDRGSADGFQYPSHSAEIPTHSKDNLQKLPQSQFLPTHNQHTPGVFDDRGAADDFQYPSNSAENTTYLLNNPNNTLDSKFQQPHNQPKSSSLDDGYNKINPLKPWMHFDHDQYKPSSFDNVLNEVHSIPWSLSDDHDKDSDTVTAAPEPGLPPDYDQYKPSSFDHLFNGIHHIPWSVPDVEITTLSQKYGPSMAYNPSLSNQDENTDLTDVDDNQPQIEHDVSTPPRHLTNTDSTLYNVLPKLEPDSDPDSQLPTDDGKITDYYDQFYPIIKAVKKLSDPPIDDSAFSVDQLDLLPFLFPGIAKILNYEPSQDQDDILPVENHEVQRINPFSKLKSKLAQMPENNNGIIDWLKSKVNKLIPTKDNATDTKNDIDMTKIFNLLSKLTPPKLKHTTVVQNIPFSGFDPEIIDNIMNDFKDDNLTTTSTPHVDSTNTYENRFSSVPTISEESRPQGSQLKYPDVHIILHQPNDEDDMDLPPYIETDGEMNLDTEIDSEELSASLFPKMLNPRYRHRPKDQKEECGDGTQWISNCHGCSCYFGQAMCFKLPDCELRPMGEPMTCKPYSHFKMGCYTCECNGDGVAECDATNCNTQPSEKSTVSGSTKLPLPVFNEFFDSKKTNEILQYYNVHEKLPKDCSKQDLQAQYPTCERGTSWVSSCHKCECNENGKHECTKIDDCELDFDSYGKPSRCKPNSKFYPKTNSMPCVECSCNDEGIPYCPAVDYKKH